jgi:transcriptional regulator with XRE-family HTH domain
MLDDAKLYATLGERILRLRRMQSPLMSQERLAGILGLTRTSVTNIERGKQRVTLDTIYKLCETFGVAVADLMPTLSEVSRSADQSVMVGGQSYELPSKTADSVKRHLPAAVVAPPVKGRRGRNA